MIALFDTNIALDILLERDKFFKESLSSVIVADYNDYDLCITSNTITDIYYIASKIKGRTEARSIIEKLFGLFDIIGINKIDCMSAYEFEYSKDFEDSLLYASAKRNHVDCIITRNIKDFTSKDIKIYTPASFLNVHPKPWEEI